MTDDVSFAVAPGGIHAVIGPNGAGKTTLIHQLSRHAAAGCRAAIRFAGRDVTGLRLHRRARLGLARSFQITSVVPGFSALENAALAVQARSGSSFRFLRPAAGEAALNAAAMAALDQVGLAGRAAVAGRGALAWREAAAGTGDRPGDAAARCCCWTSRWPAPGRRRRSG